MNAIKVSGDALLVLIDDILDLAKVDSGKMTFVKTTFNFLKFMQEIVKVFEIKLQEKNIALNLEFDEKIPALINGDVMRLRQIILNLVGNSVKFTTKGHISLNIIIISQNKDSIVLAFSITDTGIGINKNKIDTIFNNFEQVHNSTSIIYGGTGLGLAIVKQLIENQGGSITVKSEINKGSTFTFHLEFGIKHDNVNLQVLSANDAIKDKGNHDFKHAKILIVEDSEINQLLIKVILKGFAFDTDIASNGQIAIDKMQTNNYDLILMDLHMPEKNGFQATEFIRKTLKSQIPIIAITADVTKINIDKCKEVGMNDYLTKPIDEKLLYSKIIKILKDNN